MEKITLFTKRIKKENYIIVLNKPTEEGEVGCCGLPVLPYISITTPENCFGYSDSILYNRGDPYTLHRYCPAWILKELTKTIIKKGYFEYINN